MRPRILAAAAILAVPMLAQAADHIDSPAATSEPNADLTDVYAWMSADATKLNLIVNTFHGAGADSEFSPEVVYAIHINSAAAYGMSQEETLLLCKFYTPSDIECWLGDDEYLEGEPSETAGIMSASGKMRVFAGRRDDPFFFELAGFKETVKAVIAAAPTIDFDQEGCPDLSQAQSDALVGQLASGPEAAAASNTFAGSSVLSLAVQLDVNLVNGNGDAPVLGIWASTHAAD